ncbi:MAG: peptide chain release factor N(5)-glutamine methyltransferase [Thermodesulfobacteriota bacterium]
MTGPSPSGGGRAGTWTVLKILRWTTGYLESKGLDTPRLDAEVLLADLLGLSRVQLYLNFDRPLDAGEQVGFRERVRRRAAREPAAYIIGRREFYSLDFKVNPQVLIPRPETELLVDEALDLAHKRWPGRELVLADVGTGCGAVAVALAVRLPSARLYAVDASAPALTTARENAARHQAADRIFFAQGDLLAPLPADLSFHLIAANLPYVPRSAFDRMSPEVRDYEPRLALDGGQDGLDLIRRLAAKARDRLRPQGAVLLEVWPDHAGPIRRLADELGYARVRIIPDLAGRDRVAVLEVEDQPGA